MKRLSDFEIELQAEINWLLASNGEFLELRTSTRLRLFRL